MKHDQEIYDQVLKAIETWEPSPRCSSEEDCCNELESRLKERLTRAHLPWPARLPGVKRGEGGVQIEVAHIGVRLELDPSPGLEERIKRCREGYPELIMVFCGDVPPELFERALDFETTPTPFSETNVAMVNRGLKLRREGKKLVV